MFLAALYKPTEDTAVNECLHFVSSEQCSSCIAVLRDRALGCWKIEVGEPSADSHRHFQYYTQSQAQSEFLKNDSRPGDG